MELKIYLQDDIIIKEGDWFKTSFMPTVCKRGRQYLISLKSSCIISAAKAISDHLRDWYLGTEKGVMTSMGVVSDGSYNLPKGLIASRPVQCLGNFQIEFFKDLKFTSL